MSRVVIVLCEDRQQEVFIRQWLMSHGFQRRAITVRDIPVGRGSGEAHVRHEYPNEVKALRQVNSYSEVGRALVTIIDADKFTVKERHDELERKLRDAQLAPRQPNEQIAILVPKRNIETWIHHLRGVAVDEENAYPKLTEPSDCKPDVRQFVKQTTTGNLQTSALPSLQMALAEMERIN